MIFEKSGQTTEVRNEMRGGVGEIALTALCGELPAKMRLFTKIVVAPGSSIGEHVHEGETELFYFAKGNATVLDDGVRKSVSAGDVMSTGSGHSHSVINEGDEDVVMIAAIVLD